jgi:ribosomal protein S18 acetylase RimI-like enzyme
MAHENAAVRRAEVVDAEAIGRLLHDFNSEFGEPTPGPRLLAERVRELLADDEITVLLAGRGPDGLAVLRFRPDIWTRGLECYLAELYVVPSHRGYGLGRALMETAIELARAEGSQYMDIATGEDDTAARGLYESVGFSHRGGKLDGPVTYHYERDL